MPQFKGLDGTPKNTFTIGKRSGSYVTLSNNAGVAEFLGNVLTPQIATDVVAEKTSANGVTVDGCLIKDGRVVTGYITTNTTWNIASSGGDYTSLRAAMTALNTMRIDTGAVLTLQLAGEVFTAETAPIFFEHPDLDKIEIKGQDYTSQLAIVSYSYLGSAEFGFKVAQAGFPTGITTGMIAVVEGQVGNDSFFGGHTITAITDDGAGNWDLRVGVIHGRNYLTTTPSPVGTVKFQKSVIKFNGSHGFIIRNGRKIRNLQNFAITGNKTSSTYGLWTQDCSAVGISSLNPVTSQTRIQNNLTITNFTYGINAENNSHIQFYLGCLNNNSYGIFSLNASIYAASLVACNNGITGIYASGSSNITATLAKCNNNTQNGVVGVDSAKVSFSQATANYNGYFGLNASHSSAFSGNSTTVLSNNGYAATYPRITDYNHFYGFTSSVGQSPAQPYRFVRAASIQAETLTNVIGGYVMDGVTLAVGDWVLLKDQSSTSANGIYEVKVSGAPSRAQDSAYGSMSVSQRLIHVSEGTVNAGKFFQNTNTSAVAIGTDPITYVERAQFTRTGTTVTPAVTGDTFSCAAMVGDLLTLKEITTPATPASGYQSLYPKADGKWYALDDAGSEVVIADSSSAQLPTDMGITGFVDPENVTLAYNYASRELTVSGTFEYWHQGTKYTKTAVTETLPHGTGIGVHYYWYDGATLTTSTSPFSILLDAPVAIVYYNNTAASGLWTGGKGFVIDERHTSRRNLVSHLTDHLNLGAYAIGSNFALNGTYSVATGTGGLVANSYGVESGTLSDDGDITKTLAVFNDTAGVGDIYPVFWREGSGTEWRWAMLNLPYPWSGADVAYNQFTGGAWQLTAITTNSRFQTMYLCATTVIYSSDSSSLRFIWITGQTSHTTLANAQNESILSLDLAGLPFSEIVPLKQIVMRRESSYDDAGYNARIESTTNIVGTRLNLNTLTSSPAVHNNLSGRSATACHPALSINTDLTNFTGNLTATEVDVQLALDKLSNPTTWAVGTSTTVPTVYGSASASGNLTLASTSDVTKGYLVTSDVFRFENAAGLLVGKDNSPGSANVAGQIKLIGAGDNAYYTTITAGTQSANADYTLPTALPAVSGYVLSSTTGGVMSWVANGGFTGSGAANRGTYYTDTTALGSSADFVVNTTSGNFRIGLNETSPAGTLHTTRIGASTLNEHYFDCYTTEPLYRALLVFRKSHANTKVLTATVDGETIGSIAWAGTNNAASPAMVVGNNLKILQAGSAVTDTGGRNKGNFVFETSDGATTLRTAFQINWDKKVIVGGTVTTPNAVFTVSENTKVDPAAGAYTPQIYVAAADSSVSNILIDCAGATPVLYFRRSNNTLASPSAVNQLQAIGGIQAYGYGTSYASGAYMLMVAEENWTASAHGTAIAFATTPIGSTTNAETLRLGSDGILYPYAGITLGKDNTASVPNVAGTMKLISAGDNAYYTTITAGTQSANATYTLPTAMPGVTGYVLSCTTAGVMSWVAQASGAISISGTPAAKQVAIWASGSALQGSNDLYIDTTTAGAFKLGVNEPAPIGDVHVSALARASYFWGDCYSDTSTDTNYMFFRRYNNDTRTLTQACTDGFVLGSIGFGAARATDYIATTSAQFKCVQSGAAGSVRNSSNFVWDTAISGTLASAMTLTYNGILMLHTVGGGIYIKEGTNAKMGTSTLSSGSVTVNNTSVTANSRIFLSPVGTTNAGMLSYSVSAGASFTITSSNGSDARAVAWIIFEPS